MFLVFNRSSGCVWWEIFWVLGVNESVQSGDLIMAARISPFDGEGQGCCSPPATSPLQEIWTNNIWFPYWWYSCQVLVGGLEHGFFPPYIGNNHPNWLIFFRGVQTTNQKFLWAVHIVWALKPCLRGCWARADVHRILRLSVKSEWGCMCVKLCDVMCPCEMCSNHEYSSPNVMCYLGSLGPL